MPQAEVFTSSMVSEKLGHMHQQQINQGNQKRIEFKNKFEEPVYELKPRAIGNQPGRNQSTSSFGSMQTQSRNNKENQSYTSHTYMQQQQSTRSRQAPQQAQNSMDPQYTKLMQAMNDKLNKGSSVTSYAV